MDLRIERVNLGERIVAVSAIALFICMFLGWFDFGFGSYSAWESLNYISPVLAIAIAFTLVTVGFKAAGRSLGDVPVGPLVLGLGVLAAVLVLFRLIDPVSFDVPGYDLGGSREAGLFLGFAAALGMALGGYLAINEDAPERIKAALAGAGTPAAAPPPSPSPVPPPPTPAPATPPPPPAAPAPTPEQAPAPAAAYCESCGARIGSEDRFCGECGHRQAGPG